MTASSARLGSCNRRPPPIATTKPLLKPKQTHLADPNQNHKPPPPTHTKTHEPLLSHSTRLPLKDHKNQHRSTPKLTKTAYPHHHTVAKTTIERRKERERQREVWEWKGWGSQREWREEKCCLYNGIWTHFLSWAQKQAQAIKQTWKRESMRVYLPPGTHTLWAPLPFSPQMWQVNVSHK